MSGSPQRGYAGEERGFCQRQVLRRLAEVAQGRGLDAVVDATVADLVDVPLEDALLVVALCQLQGVDHLLELAVKPLLTPALLTRLRRDVDVLHELLRA